MKLMRIKIIACEVMKEELLLINTENTIDWHFVSMGLHTRPQKLQDELKSILENITVEYDRVILGFGLCGGAVRGLRTENCILTIPRVHDCIPVFLGSRKRFEQLQKTPGTFYLTGGWLECGNPVTTEYQRVCEKHGEKKAKMVFSRMYDSYKRVLFLHTDHPRDKAGLASSEKIASLLDLECCTARGSSDYLNRLVNGPWNEDEFIQLAPCDILEDSHFGV